MAARVSGRGENRARRGEEGSKMRGVIEIRVCDFLVYISVGPVWTRFKIC